MKSSNAEYIAYLKKLKKEELVKVIKDYNLLVKIFGGEEIKDFAKAKKDILANDIEEVKNDYFKYIVMSLDMRDFETLKRLITKKCDSEFLEKNKDFINYLVDKRLLWRNNDLEVSDDTKETLKSLVKNKDVIYYIKEWDFIYTLADGIIVAYGLIDRAYFDIIIKDVLEKDKVIPKLDFYYKKEYIIDDKKIMSKKLTNKKRINSYLKNNKYKEFRIKDFIAMGNNNYHHKIKTYKKFIKILKNNYIFKRKDILFVDENIVIPYLYNSLNEEDVAKQKLEETIINLFEFKKDKLKARMLEEIVAIRCDFPLWEYRGFTKIEVNHE